MNLNKRIPAIFNVLLTATLFFFLAPQAFAVKGFTDNGALDEEALFIMQLDEASVVGYRGGIEGLEATSPAVTGAKKLNAQSDASQAYAKFLAKKHTDMTAMMEEVTERSMEVVFKYSYAFNGMAVRMTPAEAAKIARLPGVKKIWRDEELQLHRDNSGTLNYALPQVEAEQAGSAAGIWWAVGTALLAGLAVFFMFGMGRKRLGRVVGSLMVLGVFMLIGGCSEKEGEDTTTTVTNVKYYPQEVALESITISSAATSVKVLGVQNYKAVGLYSDKTEQVITDLVTWTSSDTSKATFSTAIGGEGELTTLASGTVTITASYTNKDTTGDTVTSTANLTITNPLESISVTATDTTVAAGLTTTFAAEGVYADGNTGALSTATFRSGDTSVATITSDGTLTAVADGTVTIYADATDDVTNTLITGSTSYTVTDALLVSLAVTADTSKLYRWYRDAQLTATGTMTDGKTADLTNSVTWSSSDSKVVYMYSDGYAESNGAGTVTVTATGSDKDGNDVTADISLSSYIFKSVAASPATATIKRGASQQFGAVLTFTDDTTADVSNNYYLRWRMPEFWVAGIKSTGNGGENGKATGVNAGTAYPYPIWYDYEYFYGSATAPYDGTKATLTVEAPVLKAIKLVPDTAKVPVGGVIKFTVLAGYADGTEDVTSSATLSDGGSAATTVMTFSSYGLYGRVKGDAAGTATITASLTAGTVTKTDTATVTVTAESLDSIIVKPAGTNITKGQTYQFAAVGKYLDSTADSYRMIDITPVVTWDSSNDATATVVDTYSASNGLKGLGKGIATGTTYINAYYGGKKGVATVEVIAETTTILQGGYTWIGATTVWNGTDLSGDASATMGEGVVVGIIDTGIDPLSPSFAAVGGDGYVHKNPKGKYFGVCDPEHATYDPSFPCNDKLIGAYGYPGTYNPNSPIDNDGHGSHTGGTTAGNVVYNAKIPSENGYMLTKHIAGVAPHANIISYNGCCSAAGLYGAIDQAIIDGVDVINYSIGGGARDPWEDTDAVGYLNARTAGVMAVTSASNSGPGAATIGSPADAPWLMSVGASSHNMVYRNTLKDMTSDGTPSTLSDIVGYSFTKGYGPAKLVYAGDYGNPLCLAGKFNATFDGEIVVCDRGAIARVDKGKNVKANHGGGFVLAEVNKTSGLGAITTDNHYAPGLHVPFSAGKALREWLADGANHYATIGGTTLTVDDTHGDVVAGFSSRGPNPSAADNIKPDITGPGRYVFAPYCGNECTEYNHPVYYTVISGTSMSSPHLAGAAALVAGAHTDWDPNMIQSAIMLTAKTTDQWKDKGVVYNSAGATKDLTADAFDVGSGRVQVGKAISTGVVLKETRANYLKADPKKYWDTTDDTAAQPSKLNIASLGNGTCIGTCGWQRNFTSVASSSETWTLATTAITNGLSLSSIGSVTLPAGSTGRLDVTADVTSVPVGQWAFGRITMTNSSGRYPTVSLPVAVRAASGRVPLKIDIVSDTSSDSKTFKKFEGNVSGSNALAISEYGLVKATETKETLDSDPSNGNAYDSFGGKADGAFFITATVPSGAKRLVAEITASDSPDLDLFVGMGNTPSEAAQKAYAATGAALEYVSIKNPAAGTWWILVQNWAQGRSNDKLTLNTAVVTGADAGNMTATPSSTTSSKFNVTVGWSGIAKGQYYGALGLKGANDTTTDNIGMVPVDLTMTK